MNPIHSIAPNDPKRYHNNDHCTEANNIETKNIRQGTGGYPLCDHCSRLNATGR
jgi:hypothetical protein